MKKLTKGKKVVLGIIALILLLVVGTCTYFLAEHYIFYPRTIQDVIDKYEKMDEDDRRGYSVWPDDGMISYRRWGGVTYKDSIVVKNRVVIYYTEAMSEEYLNSVAKKYNAEITGFLLNPITRKSTFLGLEMKKSYTKKELVEFAEELENEPHIRSASETFSASPDGSGV